MMIAKNERYLSQIMGPLFLSLSLALAARGEGALDLCFTGCLGLFICARWQMKGCWYALALLAVVGMMGHLFFQTHHVWRLGLEASVLCSLFITAFSYETDALFFSSVQSQLETKELAIGHIEEAMAQERAQGAEQLIALSNKFEMLQKDFEEIQTEKAALDILNDVLRKNNAAHYLEKKAIEERLISEKEKGVQFLLECETLHKALDRFEQAYMTADSKLSALRKERDSIRDQLGLAEEKIHEMGAVEAKYRQLKNQFEEKSRILDDTRSSLFKIDTELLTLRMEMDERAFAMDPLCVEMEKALDGMNEEISALEQENRDLQEVATHLIHTPVSFTSGSLVRETFAVKKRVQPPIGQPSLEETLRSALVPKKKQKIQKKSDQDLLF